jgi:hypothetical protein
VSAALAVYRLHFGPIPLWALALVLKFNVEYPREDAFACLKPYRVTPDWRVCRYIVWKLFGCVIVLNMVLGVVVKSYFAAVGFVFGTEKGKHSGGVEELMDAMDQNNVSAAVWHKLHHMASIASYC